MQFKFRGIHHETGKLIYGFGVYTDQSNNLYIIDKDSNFIRVDSVDQFTGMKDKANKFIYSRDIVRIKDAGRCRVDYLEHSMKFYFQTLENHNKQFVATPDKIKVVGNIHEHSKLN